MIKAIGYKEVVYKSFQEEMDICLDKCGKSKIDVASEAKLKTHVTVLNSLNKYQQTVSDSTLTDIMKSIGLDGFIVWVEGKRKYFIKGK